jgi:hypothetical protein
LALFWSRLISKILSIVALIAGDLLKRPGLAGSIAEVYAMP